MSAPTFPRLAYLDTGEIFTADEDGFATDELVATMQAGVLDDDVHALGEAMAAVPDMYRALRAAKNLCDNINEFGHVTDSIILDAAEAAVCIALAKARGEPAP